MPSRPFVPFEEIALWNVPPGATGAEQMALDEVMLRLADRPTLRVYRWARPEVTFGYPQRWEEARAFAGGRPVTRRCTGGGFVEHGDDLTVALAVPAAHPFARLAPGETYHHVHEAIRRALGPAETRLADAEDCRRGPACFASPVPHDILRGTQKIAGGAQRRSRDGFLYQGSIRDAFALAAEALAAALGEKITAWISPSVWAARRDELVATRYGHADWTRRR